MVAHPGSYRSCHELHLHESLVDHACGISLKVKREAERIPIKTSSRFKPLHLTPRKLLLSMQFEQMPQTVPDDDGWLGSFCDSRSTRPPEKTALHIVKTHRDVRDLLAHELESELLRLAQPQLGPALPSIVGVASRVVGLQSRGLPVTPEGSGARWLHDSLLNCFTDLQYSSRGLHFLPFPLAIACDFWVICGCSQSMDNALAPLQKWRSPVSGLFL